MSCSYAVRGCLGVLAVLIFIGAAQGQGLLERLEKRLEGVLGGDERPAPAAAPAPVEPGYLGVTGDDDEAGRGVKVLAVRSGGPAEAAGLRKGDVIVGAAGEAITKLEDLEAQLEGKLAGNKIEFKIDRGGKVQTIAVTLGRPPAPAASTLPPPRPEPPFAPEEALFPTSRASLGITVLPVTDEARRRYGLSVRQGALISAINPGGAADRAGLPVGGVVVAAEGRRIDHPDDLIETVRAMRPGEKLMLSYYQGGTLYRKTVTLAEAPAEARVVAGEDPRPATDRPLLRRIEKAIEGVAGGERPAGIPFAPVEPAGDLRTEVARLQSRVDDLERRVEELEALLAEKRPAKDDGEADPLLKLNRPEPPPPPKPEAK